MSNAPISEYPTTYAMGENKLLLDALKSEKRQVRRNNDQRGEEDRAGHLHGGGHGVVFAHDPVRIFLPVTENVFHHDDRGVHDDAEINRAQRQQIGGNIGEAHADEGEEKRKRNRYGNHQGAARAAQEKNQNNQDQPHAFQQSVRRRECTVV